MSKKSNSEPALVQSASGVSRRRFLTITGGLAGAGLLAGVTGCNSDDDDEGVNLGSGDTGILNYAYALEQLEAAFYTRVMQSPYTGMTSAESALLTDIRDHEVAHREFFKSALGGSAIANLTPNFAKVDFSIRSSVLATAKAFEDLGVSAYNGAGKLIKSADYLLLAGKIVSVEARHAAYIRDLLDNGSFGGSDVVDASGLDKSRTPTEVLSIAGAYIQDKINASNLPS